VGLGKGKMMELAMGERFELEATRFWKKRSNAGVW